MKEVTSRNPYQASVSIPIQKNKKVIIKLYSVCGQERKTYFANGKMNSWCKAEDSVKTCRFIRLQFHPESWLLQSSKIWRPGFNYTGLFTRFFLSCPSAAPVLRCHIILISRLKNLFAETLICMIPVMTLKLQLSYLTLHVPYWYHPGHMKLRVQDFQGQKNCQNRSG